jgi:hypothetical protein
MVRRRETPDAPLLEKLCRLGQHVKHPDCAAMEEVEKRTHLLESMEMLGISDELR